MSPIRSVQHCRGKNSLHCSETVTNSMPKFVDNRCSQAITLKIPSPIDNHQLNVCCVDGRRGSGSERCRSSKSKYSSRVAVSDSFLLVCAMFAFDLSHSHAS